MRKSLRVCSWSKCHNRTLAVPSRSSLVAVIPRENPIFHFKVLRFIRLNNFVLAHSSSIREDFQIYKASMRKNSLPQLHNYPSRRWVLWNGKFCWISWRELNSSLACKRLDQFCLAKCIFSNPHPSHLHTARRLAHSVSYRSIWTRSIKTSSQESHAVGEAVASKVPWT